jgi:hypothetical protein
MASSYSIIPRRQVQSQYRERDIDGAADSNLMERQLTEAEQNHIVRQLSAHMNGPQRWIEDDLSRVGPLTPASEHLHLPLHLVFPLSKPASLLHRMDSKRSVGVFVFETATAA